VPIIQNVSLKAVPLALSQSAITSPSSGWWSHISAMVMIIRNCPITFMRMRVRWHKRFSIISIVALVSWCLEHKCNVERPLSSAIFAICWMSASTIVHWVWVAMIGFTCWTIFLITLFVIRPGNVWKASWFTPTSTRTTPWVVCIRLVIRIVWSTALNKISEESFYSVFYFHKERLLLIQCRSYR